MKTKAELDDVLKRHQNWLHGEPGGECATLDGTDLRGVDLRGANLWGAELLGVDLREADLREANLWGANLMDTDLRGANLMCAGLRDADLRYVDLRGADLRQADLRGADLRHAELEGADFRDVKLDESAWPLGYGSIGVRADRYLVAELAYQLCVLDVGDDALCKRVQDALKPLARESRRFREYDEEIQRLSSE